MHLVPLADVRRLPADIGDDFASTVVSRDRILETPFSTDIQKQFSRYYNEFEELQMLGKGAFGAVIKVWFPSLPEELINEPLPVHLASVYLLCKKGLSFGALFIFSSALYPCPSGRSRTSWTAATTP